MYLMNVYSVVKVQEESWFPVIPLPGNPWKKILSGGRHRESGFYTHREQTFSISLFCTIYRCCYYAKYLLQAAKKSSQGVGIEKGQITSWFWYFLYFFDSTDSMKGKCFSPSTYRALGVVLHLGFASQTKILSTQWIFKIRVWGFTPHPSTDIF